MHIEDISRAFIAALEAPADRRVQRSIQRWARRRTIIGSGIWRRSSPTVVPGCQIEFAADAEPDKRSYRVSFEKIKSKLPQFKPQWDARRGAEQLYQAYRSSGLTLEEFEGPRYQRIGHIKKLLAEGILSRPATSSRGSDIGGMTEPRARLRISPEPESNAIAS